MRLLAIDPGPEQSAAVVYDLDTGLPLWWEKAANDQILQQVASKPADRMVVEMIASYGMAVGAEVFDTCVWIGRFMETWRWRAGVLPGLMFRRTVKLHLCGSARAKDPNVRQALIDRYGPGKDRAIGLKASPGPLYGLTGDCWAALGIAVTVADTTQLEAAA